MDPSVRNAIARIEVRRNDVISRGTACLVGQNLVLTALHLVADRTTEPPQFLPGAIELKFADHSPISATVLEGKWDRLEDWVLLSCASLPPETVRPLQLATTERDGDEWATHGFPDAEPTGLTVHGTVTDSHGDLFGGRVPAYQLYCREAAAGDGMPVRGLSGAPVIVAGAVVGILRWALLADGKNVGGTLYACPASLIAVRCRKYFPEPLKSVSWTPPPSPPLPDVAHSAGVQEALLAIVKLSAALLRRSVVLALALWYAYWATAGRYPTSQETTLFVVLAALVVLTTTLRARSRRAKARQHR